MNNMYVIFYFINIFATQIYSSPVITPANVYDVVSANFSKTCPVLSSNVLVNSTTKYLSNCKDISLINPPEHIVTLNINKFYCIGTLVADMQLCNALSKYSHYTHLPKNFEELESQISNIQKMKPADICTLLKNLELFNDTTIIPTLSKTVTQLKENLSGTHCKNLCSDVLNEDKTNELCSMMYYIHTHINNISIAIAQEKLTVPNSKKNKSLLNAPAPVSAVSTQKNKDPTKHETTLGEILPGDEEKKKKINTVATQPPVPVNNIPAQVANAASSKDFSNAQKPVAHDPPSANGEEVEPPVDPLQLVIPSDTNDKMTKQSPSTTLSPAIGKQELSGLPPVADSLPKNDQTTLEHEEGEEQSTQTKNTNVSPKDIKSNADQNVGSVFLEEKDYLPPTSTEISKLNPDSMDEYNDDDDADDEGENGLKIYETKPKAEKSQEDLVNNRADINPSIKQLVDDEVEDSNFFSYFMFISVMFIAGYVVYHNKQKIMALVLEGRRDRNSRRRPSTSSYRKLNSNLEEAVTSKCSGSASHVIY